MRLSVKNGYNMIKDDKDEILLYFNQKKGYKKNIIIYNERLISRADAEEIMKMFLRSDLYFMIFDYENYFNFIQLNQNFCIDELFFKHLNFRIRIGVGKYLIQLQAYSYRNEYMIVG